MTRGEGFENSFWDPDITSTNGWDRLVRRMKDGKKVCQDVAHFLKERAKAESEYAKALINLAKKADTDGIEETGVLEAGWKQMKLQTEDISKIHEEAAKTFATLSEKLVHFNEEQKKVKSQHEDTVKRAHRNKYENFNKAMALKKSYENKCRDLNLTIESLGTMKQSVTVTKKELEKANNRQEKSTEAMVNADTAYKSSLETLEGARVNWESSMEAACMKFQQLEIERIDFLRNKIWEATNTASLACVLHDDACESVRVVLEECDVMNDLQKFIDNYKTGSKRPSPIEYENYYEKNSQKRKPAPKPAPTRPPPISPTKPQNFMDFSILDESPYSTVVDRSATLPPKPPRPQQPLTTDSPYSTLDLTDTMPPMAPDPPSQSKIMMTVVRAYTAMGPSELTVTPGMMVEYIGHGRKGQGQIQVKIPETRRCGLIPECHVKIVNRYSSTFL